VIAVAHKGGAPLSQIAKDFGISEPCLHRWLKIADTDDGIRPGTTSSRRRRSSDGPPAALTASTISAGVMDPNGWPSLPTARSA